VTLYAITVRLSSNFLKKSREKCGFSDTTHLKTLKDGLVFWSQTQRDSMAAAEFSRQPVFGVGLKSRNFNLEAASSNPQGVRHQTRCGP
jgi:hypothetical protein